MSKRIVLCCDGTWNDAKNKLEKQKTPSNVLKLVRAVLPLDEFNNIPQVVYHNQGVSTLDSLNKYLGSKTSFGISKSIMDCYRFLANNYVDGDEIFCFGFSRGAYTIRSLCGLLNTTGLIATADLKFLPLAYSYYKKKPAKRKHHKYNSVRKDIQYSRPKIKFLGVWDTVGPRGVPTPFFGILSPTFWPGFHDSNLTETIENAYQAFAIDENQHAYKPAIWTKRAGQNEVKQVWFSGVHRNIGGGYSDTSLSDITFKWLCDCAEKNGLALNPKYLATNSQPNPYGKIGTNDTLGYQILARLGIPPLLRKLGSEECVGEMIHESVLQRIKKDSLNYAPNNILCGSLTSSETASTSHIPEYITINGKKLPILKTPANISHNLSAEGCKRNTPRISANDEVASIIRNGETTNVCQVIDFSEGGGVKLRLAEALNPGSKIQLESPSLGKHSGTVIWISEDIAGVQFAA